MSREEFSRYPTSLVLDLLAKTGVIVNFAFKGYVGYVFYVIAVRLVEIIYLLQIIATNTGLI